MLFFTIILIRLKETAQNFRQNKMTIPSSELLIINHCDQIIQSMSWTRKNNSI